MTPPIASCAPSRVAESAELSGPRIAQLAADHQAATDALRAPDVTADLTEAARDTARALGLNAADPRVVTVLLRLASRSYSHGHMDSAETAREQGAVTPLARLLARSA